MADSDKTDELRELFLDVTGGQKEVTEEQEQSDGNFIGDETDARPTTKTNCPEDDCEGERAFYEMKQIRAADESETRFFTCVECGKKWREDDH